MSPWRCELTGGDIMITMNKRHAQYQINAHIDTESTELGMHMPASSMALHSVGV